ncbi:MULTISPECIES: sigma 54-interacting transcriptional regulator [unclassified Sphingomonas]|uniref:sigma 54-interacting transcriptional regulator n=1 Tax=unclassified Sphingomonas TaxID=196159 RepID=UPI0006F5ABB7|nr:MULTISPECIES: sigma 54-interacting transcriptional regulator [unclassified Sphingomonas]KQM96773.1 Fis family transcriptional regulator [Sphingomonas sp. Leaf25]KQN39551.1 Fis family transcriptional regulator [Sphingomonas sp. Leaf42]KQT28828.1 Fis family transcriptional regulator [Sphingomonas sp. Leaf407]
MRSIYPSAAVLASKFTLVSSLRAQGFALANAGQKPGPGDVFVVMDGEVPPIAARTLILADGPCRAVPFADGRPARLTYTNGDAELAHAFAAALLRGRHEAVAADPESLALYALARRVATADITVLVNGPTGTGKEVLARTIHAESNRSDGPFIAINCAALPESMLEAMLFGHVKGAFTGAAAAGEGFFRAANGGTLLLDEIAELPLSLQAKLLRVLQEREVVPIGATQAEAIDVRVVACANRDLQEEVAAGRFRADLYYRLSVFPLTTRPLSERPDDVAALAAAMIARHAGHRGELPWVSDDALAALVRHDWPGNARELENVIQRALLLGVGEAIEARDIIFDRPAGSARGAIETKAGTLGNIVQIHEFAAIRRTLEECGGSRIETAKRLGISERTLRYRLAKAREAGEPIARAMAVSA